MSSTQPFCLVGQIISAGFGFRPDLTSGPDLGPGSGASGHTDGCWGQASPNTAPHGKRA